MPAQYRFLTVEEIPDYIRSRPVLSDRVSSDRLVSVEEIGDGNLNLVFIAKDEGGRGVVIKQALPYVRMTGEGWPMTPERSRFEVQSLRAHAALVPELVVEVIDEEPERYIFSMEDLSDHKVWRGALIDGHRHEGAAEALGRYCGAVAFGTSLFGLERGELARSQERSVNPELCVVTEDLVFTEPWVGAERNSWLAGNDQDVKDFQNDEIMRDELAQAKYMFMAHAECLIHGDLHTGSVMVRAPQDEGRCDSVKVFDSEFAFYGPTAFDTGALWANYLIAAARAFALGDTEQAEWCLQLVPKTWAAFEQEFRDRWPTRQDTRLWEEAFLETLLARWRCETWLFAAAKMSRRIIGAAKTKDIETLEPPVRAIAARAVLRMSREAVRQRHIDSAAEHFVALAQQILGEARASG